MALLVYGLLIGCGYGLLASSFALIYRTTKVFHVLHAAVFTASAYACWATIGLVGPFGAVLIGLLVGCLVGIASEVLLYRPLSRLNAHGGLLFIVSLGGYLVVANLIQYFWGAGPRSVVPPEWLDVFMTVFGVGFSGIDFGIAVASVGLWLSLLAVLRWTLIGKAVRAVAAAPQMAELAGIDVGTIRLVSFALGSLLMSAAGLMMLVKSGIEPSSGLPVWLVAVVATLIARARIFASFVAGLGIGLADSCILLVLPATWQPAVPIFILLGYMAATRLAEWISIWNTRASTRRKLADASVRI